MKRLNDATPSEWNAAGEKTQQNQDAIYQEKEALKQKHDDVHDSAVYWERLSREHPALEPASCNPSLDRAMLEAHKQSLSLETEVEPTFKLPEDAEERKAIPIYTGFIDYFPRAVAAVSHLSLIGGIQHGQTAETLHWNRSKSGDELDAMMRHVIDKDWVQVAWRAMANLEKKLEVKAEAEESHRASTFGAYTEEHR